MFEEYLISYLANFFTLRHRNRDFKAKVACYSSQHSYKWQPPPQESAIKMITNCRTCHPFPLLLNSSLHVELIPKAGPTENKQKQQTPPYRKAVYQVLRAKFLSSQENRRKAIRNCTVAQAAKKLTATLFFFLQHS